MVRAVQEAALTRRAWLGGLLASLVAGFRRLRAQGLRRLYLPLSRPVTVPLAALEVPRRARRFRTQGVSPPTAANPNQPVRVNWMVVRISAGDLQPERFRAVCTVCPHEQCEVDFVSDPENLDPLVRVEIGEVEEDVLLFFAADRQLRIASSSTSNTSVEPGGMRPPPMFRSP